jgi:serine/threonine protein phosphatase PrpC
MLVSALGGSAIEHIDQPAAPVALAINDVIVLASDGLDVLSDADIARIVEESVDQRAEPARALVAALKALDLPRQDNATVVTARVLGTGAPASADDPLPAGVVRPANEAGSQATGSAWTLVVGLALLAAVLLSVIMTQTP